MFKNKKIETLEEKIDALTQKIELISQRQNSQYTDVILQLREIKDQINEKDTEVEPIDKRSKDELYEEALKSIINIERVSTSYLQRKLGIGYSRAANLVDQLEENGVIGPATGASPRKVLIKSEE
jgi:S-DNA-T family DNA segregation ATPase FtsK/SpoIIIE